MKGRGIHPPERIIAFSDGVVAIAITLLLLPLAELDLPANGRITTLVSDNAQLLGGLTLTWVIIAVFWLAHHRLFEHIVGVDQTLLWLNFGWLFAIALLPLPTNIVIANDPSPQVTGFYIGWMAIISLFMSLILWRARHRPGLMDDSYKGTAPARAAQIRSSAITGVFALSLGIAMIAPDIATYFLLLMFLVDPVVGRIVPADDD